MNWQENDPHSRVGMKFSALFRPPWDFERINVESSVENRLRENVMGFVNRVAIALDEHGLSPLRVPTRPFPDFSYVAAATRDAVLIVLGTSPFRMVRTAVYRDLRSPAARPLSVSELRAEYEDEHGWTDCLAATLPIEALTAPNDISWPAIEKVAINSADEILARVRSRSLHRQSPSEGHTQGRTRVFISYSHKDKAHLERLKVHLAPQIRAGLAVWDDTRIGVGQLWREEIATALNSARVAILLVSADFLASEFITENELPPLLTAASTGGTRIVSVIVGACNFKESPLGKFQAINEPSKPLNTLRRPERDKEWVKVAAEVSKLGAEPLSPSEGPQVEHDTGEDVADVFWTKDRIYELERDLEILEKKGDFDEDAAWLRERLQETDESEKARMLTIWDSLSELRMDSYEGNKKPNSSRLIGFLRDWRVWHGG